MCPLANLYIVLMELEDTVDRLEGSTDSEVGGLVIKKKSQVEHEFKKPALPTGSVLGLDRLAGSYYLIIFQKRNH